MFLFHKVTQGFCGLNEKKKRAQAHARAYLMAVSNERGEPCRLVTTCCPPHWAGYRHRPAVPSPPPDFWRTWRRDTASGNGVNAENGGPSGNIRPMRHAGIPEIGHVHRPSLQNARNAPDESVVVIKSDTNYEEKVILYNYSHYY